MNRYQHVVSLGAIAMAAFSLGSTTAAAAPAQLSNDQCLVCHGVTAKKIEVEGLDGEPRAMGAYDPAKYVKGVHGKMQCVDCHGNIVDNKAPHQKTAESTVECAACHRDLYEKAKADGSARARPRLETVVRNATAYDVSFHARPDPDVPERPNATCTQCHDTHTFAIPATKKTPEHNAFRATVPEMCGTCHEDHIEDFRESVHGVALMKEGKADSAACHDCHTTHDIDNTSKSFVKLVITSNCGNCHEHQYETYKDTYHGQVYSLGYAHTAKCFDCHSSHDMQGVEHEESRMHVDNRLKACQKCHDGKKIPKATEGFISYGAHAHANDFEKYPEMWIASRFMVALLIGVFAFFWLHSGLWYYREWKDRKDGKSHPHMKLADMQFEDRRQRGPKHVLRFAFGWRFAHLLFAIVTMTLVLSGTTALFAESFWAPAVAELFGGPEVLGGVHRAAALFFLGIFLVHFVFVMFKLLVLERKTFKWFGPDSLIPNWQDLKDCYGMFMWFLGKGPKPLFDRWAYFEKFDYWAVFWGVNVIGFSGLMLAFPHVTAQYLPGWVFNVATLVHGEEAFLAAVFLFTVHFFNNHFRPDKLPPPDIVMFTGTLSLDEFRRDHPAQFRRLHRSGELEKYLVDAPAAPMRLGSKVLGLTLIAIGLILLVLVISGFLSH